MSTGGEHNLQAQFSGAEWEIADPRCFKTDNGDCVVTCATGLNVTGNTIITFDTAGEMIELVAIQSGSDLRWRALACLPTTDTASLS